MISKNLKERISQIKNMAPVLPTIRKPTDLLCMKLPVQTKFQNDPQIFNTFITETICQLIEDMYVIYIKIDTNQIRGVHEQPARLAKGARRRRRFPTLPSPYLTEPRSAQSTKSNEA